MISKKNNHGVYIEGLQKYSSFKKGYGEISIKVAQIDNDKYIGTWSCSMGSWGVGRPVCDGLKIHADKENVIRECINQIKGYKDFDQSKIKSMLEDLLLVITPKAQQLPLFL